MIWGHNSDNIDMGSDITNVSTSSLIGAIERSTYNSNDCINMTESTLSGSRIFTKFGWDIDRKMEVWKNLYVTKSNNHPDDTNIDQPLRFGEKDVHKTQLLQVLSKEMSHHQWSRKSYVSELMESSVFQGWF